nr:endonuclease/exonuclease/phosphatase family protein [Cellulomonas sp. APG4]
MLERGTVGLVGPDAPPVADATALVVLVLNTQDSARPDDVARLVVERRADVVVLPETRSRDAARVAAATSAAGWPLQVLADDGAGPSATGATALLLAEGLGHYEVTGRQGGTLAGFTATGKGPEVTAVHPFPPLPGATATWHEEGAVAVATCEATPGAIVAGDFNTTPDHPAFAGLSRCVLATVEGGAGGVGTWPARLPRALGAPIDHVLVDARTWRVERAAVLNPPAGTDHRAVEVVLRSR